MNFAQLLKYTFPKQPVSPTTPPLPKVRGERLPRLTPGRLLFKSVMKGAWLTAMEVKLGVGHTLASVRTELRRLEKEHLVIRRVVEGRKQRNGQPATEWTWMDRRPKA
jgi:hypothetical protein